MAAGGITVPTYTTNTARDHLHILENSGAVAAIVSSAKLARPLLEAAYQSSHCRHIIGFDAFAYMACQQRGEFGLVRCDGIGHAQQFCAGGGIGRGGIQQRGYTVFACNGQRVLDAVGR